MPSQLIQVQNLFKNQTFHKNVFLQRSEAATHPVQAHDDQAVTRQMSDESFHDANEENIPSDDDFVHNYMICVQESSIQQKQQYAVMNTIAKFKWLQQIVEVKFSPYDTNSAYMDAYVDTIVSDNGLCYTSKEFCELMQQKGVNHILVLPHHPQSNGMAEKYVGIVKQLLLKAREEGRSS